jgi:hypothetical protein
MKENSMFQETEGDAGKTIWLWRLMLWLDDDQNQRMKTGSISWYDKDRESPIWQLDFTFWPPKKGDAHYV